MSNLAVNNEVFLYLYGFGVVKAVNSNNVIVYRPEFNDTHEYNYDQIKEVFDF